MSMLGALWSLKIKEVNSKTLRTCIAMRKYIASQFRPSAAKAIYQKFNSKNVLDFSSGWGDRLCGFCASDAESYTGVDPNENLKKGYYGQKMMYGMGKHITMICDRQLGQAQTVNLEETYDTIFTSPPYFNIERYTQEDNQSFKQYRKFEDWMSFFLYVSLDNVWKHLEINGHLIVNISDVYSNHTVNKICDSMNDHISLLSGASYQGCYGYQMMKRPNSGSSERKLQDREGIFAEPMWIWKKTT